MARPKRTPDTETVRIVGGTCVQCARLMERNTPERWANEPGNHDKAWWNLMDFYCPHCHSFQNTGDDAGNRYVKPSGKYLETGRTFVTVRVWPPTMFEGNNP